MSDDVRKRSVKWGSAFELTMPAHEPEPAEPVSAIYETKLGRLYQARVEEFLDARQSRSLAGRTQLIFTSPPFPLLRKKRYGNLQGEEYVEWFSNLAPRLKTLLTDDGSIVVEIGNVWEPGHPVMSTVVLRALLAFLEKAGLHLCQEFVWYNPARLPSPVQWVNVERVRVKDSFSRVWWMAATERPKADNRNVLKPYSASMEKLLKRGTYNAGPRPSQHSIGETSFKKRHQGAIPPSVIGADDVPSLTTLLKASNTKSSEEYQRFCRASGHAVHPARMPSDLAEFFVKFLTDKGDLVFDPFGGSNTTGFVAQSLGRRWVTTEARWDYAVTSLGRFEPSETTILTPTLERTFVI